MLLGIQEFKTRAAASRKFRCYIERNSWQKCHDFRHPIVSSKPLIVQTRNVTLRFTNTGTYTHRSCRLILKCLSYKYIIRNSSMAFGNLNFLLLSINFSFSRRALIESQLKHAVINISSVTSLRWLLRLETCLCEILFIRCTVSTHSVLWAYSHLLLWVATITANVKSMQLWDSDLLLFWLANHLQNC